MSLVEHLTELRRRLIIMIGALMVGGILAFILYNWILGLLVGPYRTATHNPHAKFIFLDPLEGFTTRLKVSAFAGATLASPVILWQIWRFITPGLHKKEKRYAIPFIVSSILLFLLGALVAMLTFPQALKFLIGVGGGNLTPLFSASKYLSLTILMIIAFGIAFEFPIVLMFLQLARVVSSRKLRKWRRPAIVVIVTVAAVITPSQDPYSLFAMAIPMYIFYELSILIGRALKR